MHILVGSACVLTARTEAEKLLADVRARMGGV